MARPKKLTRAVEIAKHLRNVDPTIGWNAIMSVVNKRLGKQISQASLESAVSRSKEHDGRGIDRLKRAEISVAARITAHEQGRRFAAPVPFGFERLIHDKMAGQYRVPANQTYRKSPDATESIVPVRQKKVLEAIVWAYTEATKGETFCSIARGLEERGMRQRKRPFDNTSVKRLLTNPVYKGTLCAGGKSNGKFSRVSEHADPTGFAGLKPQHDAHDPIITEDLWQRVQLAIASRPLTNKPTREPGKYLLSGLLTYGTSRRKLYGFTTRGIRHYRGQPLFGKRKDADGEPMNPTVNADAIENHVLALLGNNEALAKTSHRKRDREKLKKELCKLIREIRIHTDRKPHRGGNCTKLISGEIEFATGTILPFTDAEIQPHRRWRQIAAFVQSANRPVSLKEIAVFLGYRIPSSAKRLVDIAIGAGEISRHPTQTGFIASSAWENERPRHLSHPPRSKGATEIRKLLKFLRRAKRPCNNREISIALDHPPPHGAYRIVREARDAGLIINNPESGYGYILNPGRAPS